MLVLIFDSNNNNEYSNIHIFFHNPEHAVSNILPKYLLFK